MPVARYDRNWWFSIPPPQSNVTNHGGNFDGMYNYEWGSHVYWESVAAYDKTVRDPRGDSFYSRPMTLSKFAGNDWRAGMDPKQAATNPSHHRYPVWWTGDGVELQGSVESMVDASLHHFKPYVHSDCGADSGTHYNASGSAGDLLRWTAHCAFGSILRFHGADHRAWTYGNHTVDVVRAYLKMRMQMLPSLISAGAIAAETGFPLIARGDFFWPALNASRSNQQYIYLNDTLVAPIWDSAQNLTARQVWIPPGSWQDAWSGTVVTGPTNITVAQPYERIPMWHRRDGGLIILADSPARRVDGQDWSSLTLDVFPSRAAQKTTRILADRGSSARTVLRLVTDNRSHVLLRISAAEDGMARAWVVRMHLHRGQRLAQATVDGVHIAGARHLAPVDNEVRFLPFQGKGAQPAAQAGPIAELMLTPGSHERLLDVVMEAA